MSLMRTLFVILLLNLQLAYFPLVFILEKHNVFSYSRQQQPSEPKDGFSQDLHTSNTPLKILFVLQWGPGM